jgi:putative hydrolase of the HAD superfamily
MIKAIFFDMDGVLTTDQTGSVTSCKYFSEKSGIPFEELLSQKIGYDEAIDKNEITNEEVWSNISREHNAKFNIAWIEEAFANTPMDTKMLNFAKSFKDRYSLGIITDNEKERADLIVKLHNLHDLFSTIIVSAEVGSTKKTTKIFEVALKQSGFQAKECIFIDNKQSNLDTAELSGMHSVFFDDELRDFDLLKTNIEAIIERETET